MVMPYADGDDYGDAWAGSTLYYTGKVVLNDSRYYVCHTEHTSSASDEPGTGADWEDYWADAGASYDGLGVFCSVENRRLVQNHHNKLKQRLGRGCPYTSETIRTVGTSWEKWNNNNDYLILLISDGRNSISVSGLAIGRSAGEHLVMSVGVNALDPYTGSYKSSLYNSQYTWVGPQITQLEDTLQEGLNYVAQIAQSSDSGIMRIYDTGNENGKETVVLGDILC